MNRIARAQAFARGERRNGFGADERIGIPHLFPCNMIVIENPRGSIRYGKNWCQIMAHDYGYIDGTIGSDGDELDVFLGPDLSSPLIYIVQQNRPGTNDFDEHKLMLGFSSLESAREGYMANYQQGWQGLRHIQELPVDGFWPWYHGTLKKYPL